MYVIIYGLNMNGLLFSLSICLYSKIISFHRCLASSDVNSSLLNFSATIRASLFCLPVRE